MHVRHDPPDHGDKDEPHEEAARDACHVHGSRRLRSEAGGDGVNTASISQTSPSALDRLQEKRPRR